MSKSYIVIWRRMKNVVEKYFDNGLIRNEKYIN